MNPLLPACSLLLGACLAVSAQAPSSNTSATPAPDSPAAPPTSTSTVPPPGQNDSAPARRTYPGLRTIPGVTGPTNTGVPTGPVEPTNAPATLFSSGAATDQAATTAAAPAPAASGRSNITPIQMQNINRLDLNLNALELPTRNVAAQQQAVLQTLRAAPISALRPSEGMINQLGSNLVAVVPSLRLTAQQRRQLAIDVNLALNTGNLNATEAQRVIDDARTLLQGSAASNPQGAQELLGDLAEAVAQVLAAQSPQPGATPVPGQVGQPAGSQSGQGAAHSAPTTPAQPLRR